MVVASLPKLVNNLAGIHTVERGNMTMQKAFGCLLVLIVAFTSSCSTDKQTQQEEAPGGEPTNYLNESQEDRDQRMKWWREARFGMFIHWGLYAVPAG